MIKKFSVLILFVSITTILLYNKFAPHMVLKLTAPKENHPSYIFDKVFTNEEFQNLVAITKNTTFKMNIRADAQQEYDFASTPIGKNGKCTHPLQHSNLAGDKCIVPARIDVGKHLLLTGGWGSKKEKYEKMVSRAKFFQHFWADFNPEHPTIMPEVLKLFERPDYLKEARKICQNQQYLDPMQASILVALPGQEIGIHYDTPWFFGADRRNLPLWLLVAMRTSGLFNDISINQVQGVAYLHQWTDSEKNGGGFYYYAQGASGPMTLVPALPNRGLIVDGCILSHGTQTFIPGSQPATLDKDLDYQIKFNKVTNKWDVSELDSGKFFKSYDENEMRITLVWRQRCFDNEAAFKNFQEKSDKSKQLKIEQIIDTLINNLIKQGKIKEKPAKDIDIVETIIQNYIKYPYPDTIFPYNYCMIPKLFPFTSFIFDYIC